MRLAGDAVEHDAGEIEVRIEALEAQHDRAGTPRHRPGVDDQDHRSAEPFRHLGGRTLVAHGAAAVEAAHDALDEGQVRVGSVTRDHIAHKLARAEPAV